MELKEAIKELRKNEKRKFVQGIDLIVNLKGVDPKRDNVSGIIVIPHEFKKKKICGFLANKSNVVDSITQPEFARFKDKKELKILVKKYDFFIANAKLMPAVATTFGKVLGPAGKMPSPQLGVLMQEDENSIKALVQKISSSIKVRLKEASIKVSVANESMSDENIAKNIETVYNGIVNILPTKKENVRNVMIKLTMSKPIKAEMK